MLVQVWRLVPAKTELIGPADDRGYSKFNRIRGLSSQKSGMTQLSGILDQISGDLQELQSEEQWFGGAVEN